MRNDVILAALCVCLPLNAQAFSSCKTTQLAGPGAFIAEEGSNPVAWGNYVYAGYVLNVNVRVVASSDKGVTLGKPVTIYSGGGARDLRLAAKKQYVYAVWTHKTDVLNEVMFAASRYHAMAGTWGAPIVIGTHWLEEVVQVAADDANVHVAYFQADGALMIASSADAGRTFSSPVRVAPGGGEIYILSQGPHVYVAFDANNRLRFAVSHDGGKSFSAQDLNTTPPGEGILAVDQITGRLSAVWREFPIHGIYRQSLDHGDTWSAPIEIGGYPTRQYMVADDGANVYVSYLKRFGGKGDYDYHVYASISHDGGRTFSDGTDLSGPTGLGALHDDDQRPIPWAWDGGNEFRLTGVLDHGIHVWSGSNGRISGRSSLLGKGIRAAPVLNSVVWEGKNTTVMYAVCQ